MGKSPPVPLSPAQREIMDIVWDRGDISAFEVRDALSKKRDVARETVRTLLTRMEEKGWLKHRVVGRTYFYSAVIPKEATLGQRVLEIVDTLCGGSAEKLMTALLDHRGLTDDEAERIQAMIKAGRTKVQSRRK
jgi:predicted transcriptional regulator